MWRKFMLWNNRRCRINRDIEELSSLSDRCLKDLGVPRGSIRTMVEKGRDET